MSDSKTPIERLDALITGLEDEVLRSDRGKKRLADESGVTEDIAEMRAVIESMIHMQTDDPARRLEPLLGVGDGAPEAKVKVVQLMRRLGHWAEGVRGRGAGSAVPEVRMTFSGEPPEGTGKTARKTAMQHQRAGSKDGEHKG